MAPPFRWYYNQQTGCDGTAAPTAGSLEEHPKWMRSNSKKPFKSWQTLFSHGLHLPIPTSNMQCGKPLSFSQAGQSLLDPPEKEHTLVSNSIQLHVIHAELPITIVLLAPEPIGSALLNNTLGQHTCHQRLQLHTSGVAVAYAFPR